MCIANNPVSGSGSAAKFPTYADIRGTFQKALEGRAGVGPNHIPFYHKWLRDYLADCAARGRNPMTSESVAGFLEGLQKSGRPDFQVRQAERAVGVLREILRDALITRNPESGARVNASASLPNVTGEWKQTLQNLTGELELRHCSSRTVKAYLHWAMRFRQFIRERMPAEVSADDAKAFLTYLAVERAVSASTQNQAFNALLFLFTKVLGLEYSGMADVPRPQRRKRIPVVLNRDEVSRVLARLSPPFDLLGGLMTSAPCRNCSGTRVWRPP